jgi:hypothetical protein
MVSLDSAERYVYRRVRSLIFSRAKQSNPIRNASLYDSLCFPGGVSVRVVVSLFGTYSPDFRKVVAALPFGGKLAE